MINRLGKNFRTDNRLQAGPAPAGNLGANRKNARLFITRFVNRGQNDTDREAPERPLGGGQSAACMELELISKIRLASGGSVVC